MSDIITTLETAIPNVTTETISIVDAKKLGFNIGNFLKIDDEIFEIRTIVTSNTVYVKRGVFGSIRTTHSAGAVVSRISKPTTYLPQDTQNGTLDPSPPTIISFNNNQYEVARTYSANNDPKDVGSLAVGKLAVIGPQDEPANFVSVDVSVEIASNISKNETTGDTITEYTSFYSRPKLWRSGGFYDVDKFNNAFHFRALPIQEDPLQSTQTILSGIATFYGNEKKRVYLSNLTGIELNNFVVQSTYFPSNLGNRSRIIGIGGTYVDLNTEHSFVGIATTANITVVGIKTSDVETEFGYYFEGESVNFDLVDWSYGFYYGNSDALKNCTQPTHRRWGVFIETSPWNPCDPNSQCEGEPQLEINQTWNFFEDLTLFGDYRSIGSLDEFHPEPLVQILRPKHDKRGLYVKDMVGIGTTTDRRIQLYVDNSSNPCPDKSHALYVIGNSTFDKKVGIATTNPITNLHVIGDSSFISKVGVGTTNPKTNLHVVGDSLITGITTIGLGTTSSPDNSQLTFELANNTTLRIRVRGTDGVVRTGIVTLA